MTPKNIDNLLALITAVLGERADADQVRCLNELLASEPDAVELFAFYSQQEVDLRHTLRTEYSHSPSWRGAAAECSESATNCSPARSSWGVRKLLPLVATAAALAVLAGGIRHFVLRGNATEQRGFQAAQSKGKIVPVALRKPPAPVAVLAAAHEAVWKGRKILLGQSLREGDSLTLMKGEARISMGFGAEIAAKGPCGLRIVARDRVQLQFGEVAVHVAEWAKGFTVQTPTMDVVDLGTTFVVSASRGSSSETSVIQGQVRVSPHKIMDDGPRSVLVSEGESLEVERSGRRTALPSKLEDSAAYIDFGVEHPYRPIGLHNSGYEFDIGDEDPYWRVIAGPKEFLGGPQFAMVCVPDERYLPNDRASSQWVSMANWRQATPNSMYTFETQFDLTDFELSTVQLFGRFLADNGIHEVRVNGRPVNLESWVDNVRGQYFSQPQFRTVNVTDGLRAGANVIEIDVWNGLFQPADQHKTTPNPMALRVEWEGFGRPKQSSANKESSFEPRLETNVATLHPACRR